MTHPILWFEDIFVGSYLCEVEKHLVLLCSSCSAFSCFTCSGLLFHVLPFRIIYSAFCIPNLLLHVLYIAIPAFRVLLPPHQNVVLNDFCREMFLKSIILFLLLSIDISRDQWCFYSVKTRPVRENDTIQSWMVKPQ